MYNVIFLSGEYADRNRRANELGCALKIDGHLNATGSPTAGYSLCEYNRGEDDQTIKFCKDLANLSASATGATASHIRKLNPGDRGHICTAGFNGDGVVWEPGFASNPKQARLFLSAEGKEAMAQALVKAIKMNYPAGVKVAFSVGHKGKPSAPSDRGASLSGTKGKVCESDIMEPVLHRAAELLTGDSGSKPKASPKPKPSYPADKDPSKMSVLSLGDEGGKVSFLQQVLNAEMPGSIKVDGDFGPRTEAFVKAFQRKHGLKADGVVGPKTWAKLL